MQEITFKIITLIILMIITSFIMYYLFQNKPRQKFKSAKNLYEIIVIVGGFLFALYSYIRIQTTPYETEFTILAMCALYVSITHITSNLVGRYK